MTTEEYGQQVFVSRELREDHTACNEFVRDALLRSLPEGVQPVGSVEIRWFDTRDEIVRGDDWIDGWMAHSRVATEQAQP